MIVYLLGANIKTLSNWYSLNWVWFYTLCEVYQIFEAIRKVCSEKKDKIMKLNKGTTYDICFLPHGYTHLLYSYCFRLVWLYHNHLIKLVFFFVIICSQQSIFFIHYNFSSLFELSFACTHFFAAKTLMFTTDEHLKQKLHYIIVMALKITGLQNIIDMRACAHYKSLL